MPAEGWPKPPALAHKILDHIEHDRARLLQTRGLLTIRVPAPLSRQDGIFEWLIPLDQADPRSEHATWHFDGSLMDGKVVSLRVTGFGIAVTAEDGDLLAIARGAPPRWCATAAAAEAWALLEVLRQSAFPPKMRTDCLTLLTTSRQGTALATSLGRPLARIWRAIAEILDGDITILAQDDRLVWQPAHQTVHAIGERLCSDGRRLSTVSWRANRLVDALAKQAAAAARTTKEATQLVDAARAAAVHAACCLGQVTHAANNHKVATVDASGGEVMVTVRDAEPAPKRPKRPHAESIEVATAASSASSSGAQVRPWVPAAPATKPAKRPGLARARAQQQEDAALRHCVDAIGSRLIAGTGQQSAAHRLEEMRHRVRQRLGGSMGDAL